LIISVLRSKSIRTDLDSKHYINFVLEVRATLKPSCKAVTRAGFVSSLVSFGLSVAGVTCQCALQIGLGTKDEERVS
jgi:hypothetical protein